MRVALIVGGLPPEFTGGTEIATSRIATHLGLRGHEIVIFAPSHTTEGPVIRQGYVAHFFPAEHIHYLRQLHSYGRWIDSAIPFYRPQIVQGHILSMSGILAVRLAKRLGVPSVVYARGSEDTGYTNEGKRLSRRRLQLMREAGHEADATVVQTEYMRQAVAPLLGPDSYVIPNGIDLDEMPTASREGLRRRLGYAPEDRLLLSVANFHPTKNLPDLVTAFAEVARAEPQSRLVLIGDGKERRRLGNLARRLDLAGRVDFRGRLPRAQALEHMVAADLLILVSEREGYPNVINEAFAAGLPVVVSNDGSHPEIVEHDVNGLVVPLHDHEAIAAAVLRLLEDEPLRRRMSEANRRVAKGRTWGSVAEKLEAVYEDLLKKRPG